jgi:MFS family permease
MAETSNASQQAGVTDRHAEFHKGRLFLISVLALVSTGVSFSIRSNIAGDLQSVFNTIDPLRSGKMVGAVLGVAFLGYAITIPIASALLDIIKMGRILQICSALLTCGTLLVILSDRMVTGSALYPMLYIAFLVLGLGWGLAEAVINPLATTLYPEDKTHRLNVLHAWWPGGIIIGGLLGLALGGLHIGWKVKMAVTLIPMLVFGAWALVEKFPMTERAAAGVKTSTMLKEAFKPLYIILFICMFGTAASELAPGQWVDMTLTRTVGMRGIWLLIYVSGLMFAMRHFAGTIVHRLNPIGLMWLSCLLAALGLGALSVANNPVMAILAATLWGSGVCFMWPTMYAIANEQFPKGGAFLMGLIGMAGCLSIYFVLPQMGRVFDYVKIHAAGGNEAFRALEQTGGRALDSVLATASQVSFRVVAILPAVLLLVFGAIWLYFKSKGGYKPVKIEETA